MIQYFLCTTPLSYNIFIRPPAPRFTHNVDDDYKDQRLEEFIKFYLQRYHVVCLQVRRKRRAKVMKYLPYVFIGDVWCLLCSS